MFRSPQIWSVFLFLVALFVSQTAAQLGGRDFREERKTKTAEFKARRDSSRADFYERRERSSEKYRARRDALLVKFFSEKWAKLARVPGVSLPASPDSVEIKTIDLPPTSGNDGRDVEIINALLKEGVVERHAVDIALGIIDSLGIDAMKGELQSVSIGIARGNTGKPAVVSYNVNPLEKAVLLQTQTDEYRVVQTREASKESHRTLAGTIGADGDVRASVAGVGGLPQHLSSEAASVLYDLTEGRAETDGEFRILVRRQSAEDGGFTEEVMAVSYTGKKNGAEKRAFRFHDGKDSPHNGFYTPDGVSVNTSQYLFPLRVRRRKTSDFGDRSHPIRGIRHDHTGVDYAAPTGTPVYAIAAGTVTKSDSTKENGHYVAIRHVDGAESYYLHLNEKGIAKGSAVVAGERIGAVGSTGSSTAPHLHLGIKVNGYWRNPEKIMGATVAATLRLDGDKKRRFGEQAEDIRKAFI